MVTRGRELDNIETVFADFLGEDSTDGLTSELFVAYRKLVLEKDTSIICREPRKMTLLCRSLSGEEKDLPVAKTTSLREIQHELCNLFHKPFPHAKATLTIGNQVFDQFIQQPFQTCNGSFVQAEITFKQTDDP